MGTRNLTMVISNGKTKVAQYGQWDGYPGGQGATALLFLKAMDLPKFKRQVSALKWLSKKECEKIDKDPNWTKNYPYLSRDAGADILNCIHKGEMEVSDGFDKKKVMKNIEIIGLTDSSDFVTDSLFCEWAYVIDLDKEVFEVYKGFNQEPLTATDRFFDLQKNIKEREDKYYPVKLVKSYSLKKLPAETTFITQCEPKEEEEA